MSILSLTDKPDSLERQQDGKFVYEGLVSANLRQPRGPVWQEFSQDVVNSFSDPQFDGFNKVTDPNEVRTFRGFHYPVHHLVLIISRSWNREITLALKPKLLTEFGIDGTNGGNN